MLVVRRPLKTHTTTMTTLNTTIERILLTIAIITEVETPLFDGVDASSSWSAPVESSEGNDTIGLKTTCCFGTLSPINELSVEIRVPVEIEFVNDDATNDALIGCDEREVEL